MSCSARAHGRARRGRGRGVCADGGEQNQQGGAGTVGRSGGCAGRRKCLIGVGEGHLLREVNDRTVSGPQSPPAMPGRSVAYGGQAGMGPVVCAVLQSAVPGMPGCPSAYTLEQEITRPSPQEADDGHSPVPARH
ncbi:hypothetical protein CLM62_26395 [Streptomyces sp. SA15]|nr:hypothetical protein CLM62_26395 [Streptomyces sp. SA15]